MSHGVFDDTEYISNHDESRGRVEHVDDRPPGNVQVAAHEPLSSKATMERQRYHAEDAKYEDLENETANDDVLAQILAAGRVGLDQNTSPATLNHETDNIARDKYGGDPFRTNDGVLFAVDGADHATERHV